MRSRVHADGDDDHEADEDGGAHVDRRRLTSVDEQIERERRGVEDSSRTSPLIYAATLCNADDERRSRRPPPRSAPPGREARRQKAPPLCADEQHNLPLALIASTHLRPQLTLCASRNANFRLDSQLRASKKKLGRDILSRARNELPAVATSRCSA